VFRRRPRGKQEAETISCTCNENVEEGILGKENMIIMGGIKSGMRKGRRLTGNNTFSAKFGS